MSKPKPKPNKKPIELFAVALGAYICPESIARNSADAIIRFMTSPGAGKYLDSGYDGMKKDGYWLVKIEANIKILDSKLFWPKADMPDEPPNKP
jgi:hypothetical protein